MKPLSLTVVLIALMLSGGCVGRTGKVGEPIAQRFQDQVGQLKIGQSTPADLKKIFGEGQVSLKESKLEGGRGLEMWEVFRGGDVDMAQFIIWGQIAHDKDQSLLFRFENGRLTSYESVIHPDK